MAVGSQKWVGIGGAKEPLVGGSGVPRKWARFGLGLAIRIATMGLINDKDPTIDGGSTDKKGGRMEDGRSAGGQATLGVGVIAQGGGADRSWWQGCQRHRRRLQRGAQAFNGPYS
ncbi:hypothetical protein U1Q18_011991 [Sarracenia purpurea var. burkii]